MQHLRWSDKTVKPIILLWQTHLPHIQVQIPEKSPHKYPSTFLKRLCFSGNLQLQPGINPLVTVLLLFLRQLLFHL